VQSLRPARKHRSASLRGQSFSLLRRLGLCCTDRDRAASAPQPALTASIELSFRPSRQPSTLVQMAREHLRDLLLWGAAAAVDIAENPQSPSCNVSQKNGSHQKPSNLHEEQSGKTTPQPPGVAANIYLRVEEVRFATTQNAHEAPTQPSTISYVSLMDWAGADLPLQSCVQSKPASNGSCHRAALLPTGRIAGNTPLTNAASRARMTSAANPHSDCMAALCRR
jgi:hypothetical protein